MPACLAAILGAGAARVEADSVETAGAEIVVKPLFAAGEVGLEKPVWFGEMPGRPGEFLVLEQHRGRIVLLRREDEKWISEEFYRLGVHQEGECGLLGLAFHPDFRSNRKYYLNYNPASAPLVTLVEEREAAPDFRRDSGRSGRQVLRIPQPRLNHNGGTLAFGPFDRYLYIGMGDGGDSAPAQDSASLLGKLLRIDVDGPPPYGIPPDNPFVGVQGARPEIWALGLRNPWRFSIDTWTGTVWAGDVGETAREEITRVTAGSNLGWDRREGGICRGGLTGCLSSALGGFFDPVFDYDRQAGAAVVGGLVFRGNGKSPYFGDYFFADFIRGTVFRLSERSGSPVETRQVAKAPGRISSFGTDAAGNLYLVGHDDGIVYQLTSPDLETSSIRPRSRPSGYRRSPPILLRRGSPWRLTDSESDGRVEIRDASGSLRTTLAFHAGVLPPLAFPEGLYFVRPLGGADPGWQAVLLR